MKVIDLRAEKYKIEHLLKKGQYFEMSGMGQAVSDHNICHKVKRQ